MESIGVWTFASSVLLSRFSVVAGAFLAMSMMSLNGGFVGEAGLLAVANISDEDFDPGASLGQSRWYVVRIQPNQEVFAEENLRHQRFRTFIPRSLKNIKHARKIETRRAPLFPGYGFVEIDLKRQRWRSINGTRGVLHLVMAHEQPIPVPRGVVEEFLEFADDEGIVDLSRGLAIGAEVRLRAGPFAGATGLLTGLDGKGRVEVLLRIMNGQIRLKTVPEFLEAHANRLE